MSWLQRSNQQCSLQAVQGLQSTCEACLLEQLPQELHSAAAAAAGQTPANQTATELNPGISTDTVDATGEHIE